jgi:hypothetical protein
MVKLIITCHSSTGKASGFTDKFIVIEEYRTISYKVGNRKTFSFVDYDNVVEFNQNRQNDDDVVKAFNSYFS